MAATTYGPYTATIINIHDGDTMKLQIALGSIVGSIDLGFDIKLVPDASIVLSCRLYGINAPELSTQAGKDALTYIETLVAVGDTVSVVSYGWDKYGGRFDGIVTFNGMDINQAMLDSGHAVPI